MGSFKTFIRVFSVLILTVWILALTKQVLFKKHPRYYRQYFRSGYRQYSVRQGWAVANTVPFSTIRKFYNSRYLSATYKQDNLLGNLVGFFPLGFFLPILLRRFRRIYAISLAGLGLSLFYETTQLWLGLGVFDVDDLILNTSGTLAGYLIFRIAKGLFSAIRRQEKQANLTEKIS